METVSDLDGGRALQGEADQPAEFDSDGWSKDVALFCMPAHVTNFSREVLLVMVDGSGRFCRLQTRQLGGRALVQLRICRDSSFELPKAERMLIDASGGGANTPC
jgi:hypothetical protein